MLKQAWRYAWISAGALAAIALSGVILQSRYSVYLAFDPSLFLQQAWALAAGVIGMALLGTLLDRGSRAAWLARALLLSLVFVALFQVLRRSLAASLALGFGLKLGLLLGLLVLAAIAARRLALASQWRIAQSGCLALAVAFVLQPGMPSYLLRLVAPLPESSTAPTGTPAQHRVIVVVLDEWDLELSKREKLFDRPQMLDLLDRSLFAQQAVPAGSNTLSAIPSMLLGRRLGDVVSGGPGYFDSRSGERFDASTPTLISELAEAGRRVSVVGFFHDYCRLFPQAHRCVAEPARFFPGWASAMARAVRSGNDFDSAYSDFMRQWRASFERLRAATLEATSQADNEFLWVHLNVPHPPLVRVDTIQTRSLGDDYRANLVLMADLIGEIKARIESSGTPTTLVLTSDHWLREKELWGPIYERQLGAGRGTAGKSDDQYVPFIVWFGKASPGSGTQHVPPFSTTLLRRMVPPLLDGRLASPQALAQWLASQPAGELSRFTEDSDSSGVH